MARDVLLRDVDEEPVYPDFSETEVVYDVPPVHNVGPLNRRF